MKDFTRRELLAGSAALGAMAAAPLSLAASGLVNARFGEDTEQEKIAGPSPISPPASGSIPVAFPISDGAVVIDFCGPYEVFRVVGGKHGNRAFNMYTVADKIAPITASGGMIVTPNYTFETAPPPKVIVIPAQNGASDAMLKWIREATKKTDVTMSVCAGAFVLAQTGLLSGKAATTYHFAYTDLAMQYPDVHVKRGYRFVEEGNIATAGGLTSGMDLALRVVERYYGREKAMETADTLEYQGEGWKDSSGAANQKYATNDPTGQTCVICGMGVDAKTALSSVYHGHTYYFCSQGHKDTFDQAPEKVLEMLTAK
ncbi:MAG: DJ-1/PfpI family protein [Candidatus Acidiferrales bacterium]